MNDATLTTWLATLAMVMLRLGGAALLAPAAATAAVPVKLRFALVAVISLAVVARAGEPAPLPDSLAALLAAAAGEVLIGGVIGLAAGALLAGVQLGAWHVSQQMGLTLGEVFNPAARHLGGGLQAMFALLTIVIFLATGAHRALLEAVLRTFETIPPASAASTGMPLGMAVAVLASSFALALQVAAPVLATMLLAAVAMGMLQKTLPQCNLLTTYLPVRVMLGVLVLAASLGMLQPLLARAAVELATRAGELAGTVN